MTPSDEIPIDERHHEILAGTQNGIMSTIRASDGLISSNPVGFVWDGERIRVSTLKSRFKYKNLVANPTINFCVVSQDDFTRYVEIRGFATLEDDPDSSFLRLQFLDNSGGEEPPPDLDPPDAERAIVVIHPQQVSSPTLYGGRFSK